MYEILKSSVKVEKHRRKSRILQIILRLMWLLSLLIAIVLALSLPVNTQSDRDVYMQHVNIVGPVMLEHEWFPNFIFNHLSLVHANSYRDAPIVG